MGKGGGSVDAGCAADGFEGRADQGVLRGPLMTRGAVGCGLFCDGAANKQRAAERAVAACSNSTRSIVGGDV